MRCMRSLSFLAGDSCSWGQTWTNERLNLSESMEKQNVEHNKFKNKVELVSKFLVSNLAGE